MDSFALDTTLRIWSITDNPPKPNKNAQIKIFVEIYLVCILQTVFNPFVSSIVPDKIPEIKFSFPNIEPNIVDSAFKIPEVFSIEIITENITGNYNQVTIDNYEIARETFAQLFQLTCKKQAVLFLGDEKSYFYSEYAKGAQNAAEEYGAVLHIVYVFPDFPNSLEDRKKEFIAKALAYIPEHKLEDALFCNSIGKSFFEFAEQVNCPCLDRFYYACNSPETMSVFFRRTNQLIRSVVADRNYRKTLICSFQPKVYRYITNGNQI